MPERQLLTKKAWRYWDGRVKLTVDRQGRIVNPDLVSDGGLERQADTAVAPWTCSGTCGVDRDQAISFSVTRNLWLRQDAGWNNAHQTVAVQPNTDYVMSTWL